MEQNPLVSIVLPTYNGEKYIVQALESILAQTYQNWELIVVDDSSTDSTNDIVSSYVEKDSRISIIKNEINQKVAKSLNIGFEKANGKYFTWTSDDNYYYPQALEKMVKFLEHKPDFSMVYAISDKIDENNKIIGVWGQDAPTVEKLFDLNICGACFLYTKEVAQKVGKYRVGIDLVEDHDYWIRILLNAKIANIHEHLYAYRVHSLSLTGQNNYQGRIKDYEMMLGYDEELIKTFPEMESYVNTVQKARSILIKKERVTLKTLLKLLDKKRLYSELKAFYRVRKDFYYLNFILRMGLKYFFKGICLSYKYRKNKNNFYEFNIRRYGDSRGLLTTIEDFEIPFKIKRVYYLSHINSGQKRAQHAHKSSKRVLIPLVGSCKMSLFDGKVKKYFELKTSSKAVFFDKKVWCELSDFSDDAVVLALADKSYCEKDYIRNYEDYLEYIGSK